MGFSIKKTGLFQRIKQGLQKTREEFGRHLDSLLSNTEPVDDNLLEELEALLISADFGVQSTQSILEETRTRYPKAEGAAGFRQTLKAVIQERLEANQRPMNFSTDDGPHVILVAGVNGVGKTTTIGKLAAYFSESGKSVVLAAGDTFRAAAVEQLQIWGERSGCQVISQQRNADSASVVFDAYASARARHADLLIADTAGRLHTKVNLMEELKKIQRVLSRQDARAPHDVWLVLDATTGQNAISQARQFHESLGLTGLIITKLDGTAKGGVVVGIGDAFHLPIHFLGVGEGVNDLKPFDPATFVAALFESGG
jgi:fused signal recognition particle receptor